MNLTGEQIAQLVAAAVTLATALAAYLESRRTTKIAEEGKHAATAAKDAAENVQVATVDRLDYDRLRRMEAALLTLDECQGCREKIQALADRRRVFLHVKANPDA